jgi:hypothetical protein
MEYYDRKALVLLFTQALFYARLFCAFFLLTPFTNLHYCLILHPLTFGLTVFGWFISIYIFFILRECSYYACSIYAHFSGTQLRLKTKPRLNPDIGPLYC